MPSKTKVKRIWHDKKHSSRIYNPFRPFFYCFYFDVDFKDAFYIGSKIPYKVFATLMQRGNTVKIRYFSDNEIFLTDFRDILRVEIPHNKTHTPLKIVIANAAIFRVLTALGLASTNIGTGALLSRRTRILRPKTP